MDEPYILFLWLAKPEDDNKETKSERDENKIVDDVDLFQKYCDIISREI